MNSPEMETSEIAAQIRRFFTWWTLRRIVIGLAWTATIIVLAYSVENWRCRRAWEQFRSAAEARGEHLDLSYFTPKPIPDDQNFFMAGSLPQTLFYFPQGGKWFEWNDHVTWAYENLKPIPPGERRFHFTDLATWEEALGGVRPPGAGRTWSGFQQATDPDPTSRVAAAPGVLQDLQLSAPTLDELRAASSRPDARFALDYAAANPLTIALPHYSTLQAACERLRLRACAELALGQSDDAMADLKLAFYLTDLTMKEPFLIGGLVRFRLRESDSQIIWEVLAEHRWSDAQLQEIQEYMLSYNSVAELDQELAAECASSVKIAEYYGTKKDFNALIDDMRGGLWGRPAPNPSIYRFLIWLMPRGWCHLEAINAVKYHEVLFQSVLDPAAKRIDPRRLEANLNAEARIPGSEQVPQPIDEYNGRPSGLRNVEALIEHHLIEREWLLGLDESLIRKFVGGQCMADQAAIACGLERYRLANGDYPMDLDALAPAYISALPHDPLTGESYRYRRDSADMFTLYSVGWDLKDDDGKPSAKPFGPVGDWVWQ